MTRYCYNSPVGTLLLVSNGIALTTANCFIEQEALPLSDRPDAIILQAIREFDEYFAGKRKEFSVPLAPEGTAFQKRVWDALLTIPYGKTAAYGEIASMIGDKKASRAVGGAVGKNPILMMIPCHRVIAAGGKLGGFSAGIEMKKALHKQESIQTKGM